MTLRYVDGFDYFPAGTGASNRLLEASGYYIRPGSGIFDQGPIGNNMTTGRFGFGKCMQWAGGIGSQQARLQIVRPVMPGGGYSRATGVMGLAVYIGQGSVCPYQLCFYNAIADSAQCWVEFQPNGIIKAYGQGGAVLGSTYAGAYYYDEWFYFEVKATINSTAGAMQCRVNTVPVINVASVNTNNAGGAFFDSFQHSARALGIGNNFVCQVDDFYVLDTDGTVNNDFLGNVRVKTQFTAGVGDVTTWTPTGAATNWQAAKNINLDDTMFNATNTVGDEDLYAMEAILGSQAVHGIQMRSGLRQTDATQRGARNRLKMGGVETDSGVDHYLNQTFTYYTDVIELNPSTGLGMNGTQVNAAQVGPKVSL